VTIPRVRIHYLRPPGREEVFQQHLVHEDGAVKVTYAPAVVRREPIRIDDALVLERGSDVVWFTFPGAWHDIGRFHLADGTFTGIYANVLTPPVFESDHVWRTTDLFLDVWLRPGSTPVVLDREEFDEAVRSEWIDQRTRQRALEEVDRILEAVAAGVWPPPVVSDWPLERAREVATGSDAS
jgi:predicted RNA-binding protein associated with RNAse of E/G family